MKSSRVASFPGRLRDPLVRMWKEWRVFILFFLLVWVPVRSAVVDYNPVPTGSMNPTILEGDVVWVNKLAYGLRVPLTTVYATRWSEPSRGDIVVVLSPADGTRLVKRVVGIPGDTLAMRDNRLWLNGLPVEYLPPAGAHREEIGSVLREAAVFADENLDGVRHAVMALNGMQGAPRSFDPIVVPSGSYFLMGDSRDNSFDSRAFGFARREAVLGRAGGVLVSLDINDTYRPRWGRMFTALR